MGVWSAASGEGVVSDEWQVALGPLCQPFDVAGNVTVSRFAPCATRLPADIRFCRMVSISLHP